MHFATGADAHATPPADLSSAASSSSSRASRKTDPVHEPHATCTTSPTARPRPRHEALIISPRSSTGLALPVLARFSPRRCSAGPARPRPAEPAAAESARAGRSDGNVRAGPARTASTTTWRPCTAGARPGTTSTPRRVLVPRGSPLQDRQVSRRGLALDTHVVTRMLRDSRGAPALHAGDVQVGQAHDVTSRSGRRSGQHVVRGVEASLPAPVALVVGLGRDGVDELIQGVRRHGQDGAVRVGRHGEHETLEVRVQHQRAQQGRDVVRDDDLVGDPDTSGPTTTQVVRRAFPVADRALVAADAAPPVHRPRRFRSLDGDPAGAGPVARAAHAQQRAGPSDVDVTSRCHVDDAAEELGKSPCRARCLVRQIQEVVQVGNQHASDCTEQVRHSSGSASSSSKAERAVSAHAPHPPSAPRTWVIPEPHQPSTSVDETPGHAPDQHRGGRGIRTPGARL